MTVATQVISGVHVASDGGFVAGRVARATPVAGQHIDSSTVDATVLSSPISPIDGTWSLTLIRGVVYDVKIDRWAVRTIRVTDDPTQDFSYYLETSLEIADSEGRTIPPGSITQYLRGDRTWQTLDLSAVGLSGTDPEVLADLSDAAGVLNYKGQPIQGGTALPAPPDQTGNWAYVSLGGVQQWLELVEVTGGSVPVTVDGTAGTLGAEATAQAGTATPVGTGVSSTTGAESATQSGTAVAAGAGIVSATGTEATSEAGTGVAYVLNPGTALAVGVESSAETGAAAATGAGITNAIGSESTAESGTSTPTASGTASALGAESVSETGTATASATSGGTAVAIGAEGTAETGTGTATGSGTAAAAGAQGTSETGTATASGGGGGSTTIAENFDTAIATTYASFINMAGTNTVQGWTIGSSGYDPMTVGGSASFYGARITTATGGYAGNKLVMYGAYSEDAEITLLARSGFKLTRTWTGPFNAGTFTLKYSAAAGSPTMTIKANGVSAGTLTYNAAWQTATIALSAAQLTANGGNITLEVECAPASDPTVAPVISLDSITYG